MIDAIEFGLTGQMSRLTGKGTKGLDSVGTRPACRQDEISGCSIRRIEGLSSRLSASLQPSPGRYRRRKSRNRTLRSRRAGSFRGDRRPSQIALSRREILRFILVEPTKRSEEVQTILKLDEIGDTRSAFNTAQNKLQTASQTAAATLKSSRNALLLAPSDCGAAGGVSLRSPSTSAASSCLSLKSQNCRPIPRWTRAFPAARENDFNKRSSLRDVGALAEVESGFSGLAEAEAVAVVRDLARLEADPALLAALQRRSFIEKGLELVEGPECPLCDQPWEDEQHLRDHLKAKLAKSEEARKLQEALLKNGTAIARETVGVLDC